jgi:hypothetical protein
MAIRILGLSDCGLAIAVADCPDNDRSNATAASLGTILDIVDLPGHQDDTEEYNRLSGTISTEEKA